MSPFVYSSAEPFRFGRIAFDRIVGFLIDTAVLYYVSCCLLLLGAYSMMHSPLLSRAFLMQYCETYGIFLAYVILLTGLCLLVLRRLSLAEDGLVMAGMSLLLILDPTFFSNVFYTYTMHVGEMVSTFCFLLGLGLYAAMIKVGGVPWTKRTAALTAMVAAFVYYYPMGLDLTQAYTDAWTMHYFYLLWWMPLVVAIVCEPMQAMMQRSGGAAIDDGMKKKFLMASMIIMFYIVFSHLLEADHTYTNDLHAEYLTPVFLAVGLLLFKLGPSLFFELNPRIIVPIQPLPSTTPLPQPGDIRNPTPTVKLALGLGMPGRQLVWLFAFIAACCSLPNTESLIPTLGHGIVLSPFNLSFAAVALYFFYFWKVSRARAEAMAATVCMVAALSGVSFPDAAFNIFHFHFVPCVLLTVAFIVWAIVDATPIFPTLAGGCLMLAILARIPLYDGYKAIFFLQAWAVWICLVQWHYYRQARGWVYMLAGIFAFTVAARMYVASADHWMWRIDYLVVLVALLVAGRFLQNILMWSLALAGMAAGLLYAARTPVASSLTECGRMLHSGVLLILLAFLMLPLAYFMSVLKKRRRDHPR